MKVCIACSPGGHMIQARRLAAAYAPYDHFYFTFDSHVAENLSQVERVRTVPNLHRHNVVSWCRTAWASLLVALAERPDVVISTGAGVTIFMCLFCKLMGAKLVFMESMARVERPTVTARLLYPLADLFIVQWPGLRSYFPRAIYWGKVL